MSYQLAERLSNHNMMNGSVVCVESRRWRGAVRHSGKLLQPPALPKSMLLQVKLQFIGGVQIFPRSGGASSCFTASRDRTTEWNPVNYETAAAEAIVSNQFHPEPHCSFSQLLVKGAFCLRRRAPSRVRISLALFVVFLVLLAIGFLPIVQSALSHFWVVI